MREVVTLRLICVQNPKFWVLNALIDRFNEGCIIRANVSDTA